MTAERVSDSAMREVQFVDMQGQYDCWWACMASLTGIPLIEFYAACGDPSPGDAAHEDALATDTIGFLRSRGWRYACYHMVSDWQGPEGWSIMYGPASRGHAHAVIAFNREMKHDPHPSREGLTGVLGYEVLTKEQA